jgi:hypothetical protein
MLLRLWCPRRERSFAPLGVGPFRWRGLACEWLRRANRAEAAGGRGVCISRSQGMRWQREAGGARGVCGGRARCGARDAGA